MPMSAVNVRPLGLVLSLALAALAGCDTRATAANTGADIPPARQSQEFESCGTTAHCAGELRCFESVCVRTARSTLGDYLAARGARATSADAAIADYAEALATYESEKLAVPPELDCSYGRALAKAKAKSEKAELAARVLHRCLLAAPAGSPLRSDAIAAMVELDGVGLDPKQIAKPALADLYLTRAPAKPSTEALRIAVTGDPVVTAKTFPLVTDRIIASDLREPLIVCWN